MSSHSNSSQYASSNPDSEHSSPSTAPSSIHACADSDEEHFQALQRDMGGFVSGLISRIKKQDETDIMLRAWATRCSALEEEVLRLSRVVQQLEAEKEATSRATEEKVSDLIVLDTRVLIYTLSAGDLRPPSRPPSSRWPRIPLLFKSRDALRMERQVLVSQNFHRPQGALHPSNRPQ